ncbi:right-handed parallel beta-helix repeat-containing protein [Streptomyces goshikiensis]|uniref:right-handed parallel beta-helix repeat-containing protein n=1 Tax=Streptomyces goshikiensis TaxID=1942 RepID=UPI0036987731
MPNRAALTQQAACCLGGAALVLSLTGPHASAESASDRQGGSVRVPCSTASLISAIQTANSLTGSRLALASQCTYHLTTAYAGQDGLPAITKRITILGNGATIQRDPSASGAFRILDVATGGNLEVQKLTVKGGSITGQPELGAGILVQAGGRLKLEHSRVSQNSSERNGGGVAVLGTATISDSELVGNTATFGAGLVQFGSAAKTTIIKSAIRFNVASFDGGGLEFGEGTAVVRDSHVDDNSATLGDGGGGIYSGANLQVLRSTVDRNTAGVTGTQPGGGGIFNYGPLLLGDTSVSNNTVTGGAAQGGGVYNQGGNVTLSNARITGNSAAVAPGGVWTDTPWVIRRSQISNNTPTNCQGSPVIPSGCVN